MKRYIRSAIQDILDEDREIKLKVIENPRTPVSTLSRLANDPDHRIRRSVADSPNNPPEVLAKLGDDPDSIVRSSVVANRNTPVDTILKLVDDEKLWIKYEISCRAYRYPICVVLKLLDGYDETVYRDVMRHLQNKMYRSTTKIFKKLAVCENLNFRRILARDWDKFDVPESALVILMKDEDPGVRYNLVSYKLHLPTSIIDMALDDPEEMVRYGVARDVIMPDESYYEKLSEDPEPRVREGVARNPSTPKDILLKLAQDKDEEVREWAERALNK